MLPLENNYRSRFKSWNKRGWNTTSHSSPHPTPTHRHTNDSLYYSLKEKVPKLSLSRIYGVTVTDQGQTLEGNRDSSWALRRSNHISPGAKEFSPEGLIYLILLFSNPIAIMLRWIEYISSFISVQSHISCNDDFWLTLQTVLLISFLIRIDTKI